MWRNEVYEVYVVYAELELKSIFKYFADIIVNRSQIVKLDKILPERWWHKKHRIVPQIKPKKYQYLSAQHFSIFEYRQMDVK